MLGLSTSCCRFSIRVFSDSIESFQKGWTFWRLPSSSFFLFLIFCWVAILGVPSNGEAAPGSDVPLRHIQTVIPILGTTMSDAAVPIGIVAEVHLEFLQRRDHSGLDVQFETTPGKFSPYAQQSVRQALDRVVAAAALNPDSWTIRFRLPYPGVTLYGESLSAMTALNIVALAKNDPVDETTIMTGTVMEDGHVGTVGGVPLKIVAAHKQHFRKVLIPEEFDVADGDWETPFLMDVSPVGSISKAYLALTNRPLRTVRAGQSFTASLTR